MPRAAARPAPALRVARGCALALSLLLVATTSAEAPYPSRPIRLIVPYTPGTGIDILARVVGQRLAERLKVPVVVDNRPGASGNIGAAAAAKSAADGYTFLVSANPALAVNPSLYKELPYNAERDFTPVTRGVMAPMAMVVHPSVPARTLAELVALGRTAPGKLAYGSAGTGSPTFLGVRMLEEGTGARFTHVPYKGVGAAYADLLGGQVQFLFPDVASAISHLKAGKLRALAVTQSTAVLPGTPTFAEAGFPLEVITSFSVVAPAGTPAAIVQRIAAEIGRAMRSRPVAEKLEAQVLVPVFDTPEQFAASLKKERDGWADFIRRNGIQPDQ
jgi:tripartite-type tricarboxylate transporter receptor subunit TctC